jgi:hypothetical protein
MGRGKNNLLKIVLKAKNEAYLIDSWVAHHAAIVGYENIIILDCGSTDSEYLHKLSILADRILVLSYFLYYDDIHWIGANLHLYDLIARNCRYLTVLDADEFLIGRIGEFFSGRFVDPILRRYDLPLQCGTWVHAIGRAESADGSASAEWTLDARTQSLINGTHGGKAVLRSDMIAQANYVGHNFHRAEVARLASADSLGRLIVLHAKNQPPPVMQQRLLQHLIAKRVVDPHAEQPPFQQLTAALPHLRELEHAYARSYLELQDHQGCEDQDGTVRAPLVGDRPPQAIPALADALDAANLPARMEDWRDQMKLGNNA